jgi:hypothetical protein
MFLFMRMVTRSAQQGQIEPSIASQLTTLAQDFVSAVLPFLSN